MRLGVGVALLRLVLVRAGFGLFRGVGAVGAAGVDRGFHQGRARQVTRTTVRSRVRALVNCSAHGQRVGRCNVRWRAELVIRPGVGGDGVGGSCGDDGLAESDPADPAGQVVGDHVEAEPRGVGAETPRRQMVEADPVFEVADGVFDVGVSAMIGFELERSPSRSVMKAW